MQVLMKNKTQKHLYIWIIVITGIIISAFILNMRNGSGVTPRSFE